MAEVTAQPVVEVAPQPVVEEVPAAEPALVVEAPVEATAVEAGEIEQAPAAVDTAPVAEQPAPVVEAQPEVVAEPAPVVVEPAQVEAPVEVEPATVMLVNGRAPNDPREVRRRKREAEAAAKLRSKLLQPPRSPPWKPPMSTNLITVDSQGRMKKPRQCELAGLFSCVRRYCRIAYEIEGAARARSISPPRNSKAERSVEVRLHLQLNPEPLQDIRLDLPCQRMHLRPARMPVIDQHQRLQAMCTPASPSRWPFHPACSISQPAASFAWPPA